MPVLYIIGAIILFAPIKLISDNVLYAAIVRRLKADFGIEEESVIAFVTTNLVPILVTLAVIGLIYRLATTQHRTPLAREHTRIVNKAFSSLGADELEWLRINYAGGRPPYALGDNLFAAGLVDRDFTGFTEVKEYLKPLIAKKIRSSNQKSSVKKVARQVEPSHLIILGLVIALGGAIWQWRKAPAANPQVAALQTEVTNLREGLAKALQPESPNTRLAQAEPDRAKIADQIYLAPAAPAPVATSPSDTQKLDRYYSAAEKERLAGLIATIRQTLNREGAIAVRQSNVGELQGGTGKEGLKTKAEMLRSVEQSTYDIYRAVYKEIINNNANADIQKQLEQLVGPANPLQDFGQASDYRARSFEGLIDSFDAIPEKDRSRIMLGVADGFYAFKEKAQAFQNWISKTTERIDQLSKQLDK